MFHEGRHTATSPPATTVIDALGIETTDGKHQRRNSAAPLDRFAVALDYRVVGASPQLMVVDARDCLSSGGDLVSTALK
jgi:hypothetical protein